MALSLKHSRILNNILGMLVILSVLACALSVSNVLWINLLIIGFLSMPELLPLAPAWSLKNLREQSLALAALYGLLCTIQSMPLVFVWGYAMLHLTAFFLNEKGFSSRQNLLFYSRHFLIKNLLLDVVCLFSPSLCIPKLLIMATAAEICSWHHSRNRFIAWIDGASQRFPPSWKPVHVT